MFKMILRRYTKNKVCFGLILLTTCIVYVEFVSYYLNSFNWYSLSCKNRQECTRILLVADPQIIGNNEEAIHFITPLTIFDSDRYLKKTYSHAYDFVEPDVVIFLGDLMDEAHTASKEEFHQYVRRLFNIFLNQHKPSSVRHIWLPGDNDIGGEDSMITREKVNRFEHAFAQPSLITVKNITFFKINRLIQDIPMYKNKRDFYDTNEIFVGLSHLPMMFKPSTFVEKVFDKMMPQVLFTAHEHKSMIISTDVALKQDFHIVPLTPDNNRIFEYGLAMSQMYEIMAPTCSYRMGTDKIGYGSAVIENNYLHFTVLWSPPRFVQLLFYGVSIVFIFLSLFGYMCYTCMCNFLRRRRNLRRFQME